MVDTYEGRKPMASWRRPSGRPHSVWLNKVQEDANALLLSMLGRSEIVGGHRAAKGPLGLRNNDDDDDGFPQVCGYNSIHVTAGIIRHGHGFTAYGNTAVTGTIPGYYCRCSTSVCPSGQ